MIAKLEKIGFGGGCHWCTEAVFQSLKGVSTVEQGFIAPKTKNNSFSEAVIIHYDKNKIDLKTLVEIHLHTHKSTSTHTMRIKYRSAIYVFDRNTFDIARLYIKELQCGFDKKIITQVHRFEAFKYSDEQFHNYYYSNPEKPFCETYISPKLKLLLKSFSKHVKIGKLNKHHVIR